MNKLRDNHPPRQPGEDYGAWCWAALSDEYQRKFTKRASVHLQAKVDRMLGYESLSRNDDIVLAAISYLISNRGPLKPNRTPDSYQEEFPDITVISGNSNALLVRCSKGHEWTAQAGNLREGHRCGDPLCHPLARSPDSYQEEFPDITVISGNAQALLVRCSEGHEWTVRADNLRDGKRCGKCCTYGFNPDKPSWMYLLLFVTTGILKVGITNRNPYNDDGSYAGRLAEHNDGDMRVLDIVGANDGYQIEADEGQVRRYLKVNGLREGSSYEYWQQDEFPVDNLNTLIQLTKEK